MLLAIRCSNPSHIEKYSLKLSFPQPERDQTLWGNSIWELSNNFAGSKDHDPK
jgi:hypothetical protein